MSFQAPTAARPARASGVQVRAGIIFRGMLSSVDCNCGPLRGSRTARSPHGGHVAELGWSTAGGARQCELALQE